MEKGKKVALYGNIIFGLLIAVASVCLMQISGHKYVTKSTASALFVLCGVFNFIVLRKFYKNEGYLKSVWLLIGLVFAMIGDILLIEDSLFVLGAIFFAIGHVFYFIYYCTLQKFSVVDVISFVVLLIPVFLILFFYPNFEFNGIFPVILVYAIIISLMLSKAFGNYIKNRNLPNLISLLGAFLFFFSDVMLLFYVFGGNNIIFDYFCIYTYYPAEFLLAFSVFFQKRNCSIKNIKY